MLTIASCHVQAAAKPSDADKKCILICIMNEHVQASGLPELSLNDFEMPPFRPGRRKQRRQKLKREKAR